MKYIILIFLISAVFGLSYLRHSYILNFNCRGQGQLVRIGRVGKINDLESVQKAKNTWPFRKRLVSTFWYWLFFFILNSAVFYVYLESKKALLIHLVIYIALSAISMFILGLNLYWIDRNELYIFASRIKNFLLSPVYTFAAVIFVKYVLGIVKTDQ